MKVFRKVKTKTDTFSVGDQIIVKLDGFGKFTATAQKETENGILFFFDDCVAERPMNEKNNEEFNASDLCKWMNTILLAAFPSKIKNRLMQDISGNFLTVPTYGQVFGCDAEDEWDKENIIIDSIQQLPLMANRKNRICDYKSDWCLYWLQNPLKQKCNSASFASVDSNGTVGYTKVSTSIGVRPAFTIKQNVDRFSSIIK